MTDTNPGQAIVELADLVEAGLIDEHGVLEECRLLAEEMDGYSWEDLSRAVGREVVERDEIGDYANGIGEVLFEEDER